MKNVFHKILTSGETHSNPVHIASHIMALHHLSEKQKENPNGQRSFLFANERAENIMALLLRHVFSFSVSPSLDTKLSAFDAENKLAVDIMAKRGSLDFSPSVVQALFDFVSKQSINTVFNDAVRTPATQAVDWNAPYWQQRRDLREQFNLDNRISLPSGKSPEGIALRNHHMVDKALQRARATQSKIIYQQTGNRHVFGGKWRKDSLEHSLCALFQKAGARVLPVINTSLADERPLLDESARGLQRFPQTMIRRNFGSEEETFDPLHKLHKEYKGERPLPFSAQLPHPSPKQRGMVKQTVLGGLGALDKLMFRLKNPF